MKDVQRIAIVDPSDSTREPLRNLLLGVILQALRAGAKEFLTQPVVLEDLLKALQRLHRTRATDTVQGNGAAKVESQVIAVIGSRGGVGCTSLAVNLGCTLAQEPNHTAWH
jgi:pilus assembly protein CpaE